MTTMLAPPPAASPRASRRARPPIVAAVREDAQHRHASCNSRGRARRVALWPRECDQSLDIALDRMIDAILNDTRDHPAR